MNGTTTAEIVTNCSTGPACGMLELYKIMAIVAVAVFFIGLVLTAR